MDRHGPVRIGRGWTWKPSVIESDRGNEIQGVAGAVNFCDLQQSDRLFFSLFFSARCLLLGNLSVGIHHISEAVRVRDDTDIT